MALSEDKRNDDDNQEDRSSDEDFNPDGDFAEEEASAISSEEEQIQPTPTRGGKKKQKKQKKRQRKQETKAVELDSGDEATIQERRRKRRKGEDEEYISGDEDGGEGGFVKTRSQRKTEQHERRPLANTLHATINVDAVWARLSALPLGKPPEPIISQVETLNPETEKENEPEDEYITIKRTTRFAGEVTTEEKRVHKHSAEAKLYLQEQEENRRKAAETDENIAPEDQDSPKPTLRRPLKRPSRYEPNPSGEVKALPPHLQLRWPRSKGLSATGTTFKIGTAKAMTSLPGATKLNTVEKSRYDWAGFVDKEGIAEELDEYGKSKASYLGREEFLNRAENRQEEERRDAKRKVI